MKDTEGALWGLALAGLSPVDQEELAHLVAYCNTHKAPLSLSLKAVHASEPGSQNRVTELCSYCRHSWNYLCKFRMRE